VLVSVTPGRSAHGTQGLGCLWPRPRAGNRGAARSSPRDGRSRRGRGARRRSPERVSRR
jgi:hypothetical protein